MPAKGHVPRGESNGDGGNECSIRNPFIRDNQVNGKRTVGSIQAVGAIAKDIVDPQRDVNRYLFTLRTSVAEACQRAGIRAAAFESVLKTKTPQALAAGFRKIGQADLMSSVNGDRAHTA